MLVFIEIFNCLEVAPKYSALEFFTVEHWLKKSFFILFENYREEKDL